MDLLGCGREADVYALDANRVLRRYRRGDDASGEALLMAYLGDLGFPVPRVLGVRGPDLIMERLDGPTMAQAFQAGELGVAEGAAVLAALHHDLHDLPPRLGRAPGDRILHRDLHPENVMLTSRGPVVIDWHNAAEGRPAVDVCLTAIIVAQVAADPAHPHAVMAATLLSAFLPRAASLPETASRQTSSDERRDGGDPWGDRGGELPGLAEAVEIRRADPNLGVEEAARLAVSVLPLIRAAAGQPIVTTRAQDGGRSGW